MGSGKSTVARMFQAKGAVIIDADVLAREALTPGQPAYDLVVQRFGNGLLRESGEIDRSLLAKEVFADTAKREVLEQIVHPVVAAKRSELLATQPVDAIVIEDVPLLAEKKLAPEYDFVVVVQAPVSTRLKRLTQDRDITEAEALSRFDTQASDEARAAIADVIIDNSGNMTDLEAKATDVWRHLQTLKPQ
jgi:dephospho-CoA kinase